MPSGNGLFEVVAVILASCRARRIWTIQPCSFIGRRLPERFVSAKDHFPFSLRRLRTTWTFVAPNRRLAISNPSTHWAASLSRPQPRALGHAEWPVRPHLLHRQCLHFTSGLQALTVEQV